MFLSSNNQIISDVRSAFRPTSFQQNCPQFNQKMHSYNSKPILPIFSNQLLPITLEKDRPHDAQMWSRSQIERLFKLYDYYGPQWKIMSQHMPLRTANNLKNRFYTVLRNLIKLLFRKKGERCQKLPGEIPSKDLSRLYDGKQDYKPFKNFVPTILEQINFDLDSENIDSVVNNYSDQIVKVYQTIYGERAVAAKQNSEPKTDGFQIKEEDKSSLNSLPNNFLLKQQERGNTGIQCPEPRRAEANENLNQSPNVGYICFFIYNPLDFYPKPTGF